MQFCGTRWENEDRGNFYKNVNLTLMGLILYESDNTQTSKAAATTIILRYTIQTDEKISEDDLEELFNGTEF